MDEVLTWLNPAKILDWASANPWVVTAVGVMLVALVAWQILRGSVGTRRFVVNLVGIGLVVWGTLWFTEWVRPSLTAEQLFTAPVIGPQPVKVVFATRKTIEKSATYTGTVHPFERVVINARTNGFIETVSVYPGDHVLAGKIVARLETTELQPRLAHARAEFAYLQIELKRFESLTQRGISSIAKLDLTRSKERIAAAKLKLLQIQIGYATIRAQSDGWVSERFVDPGQFVQRGKTILTYDRLHKVRVRFDVAEQDLATIKIGGNVVLEFPQIPRHRFEESKWQPHLVQGYDNPAIRARITAVFPRLHERSRLGTVEVLLDNPDQIFRSNTYVVGHLITARVQNAWVVPQRALTPMPGGKTVIFIGPAFADQGEVEMREVKVGLRNSHEARIIEGLDENAYVVVSGNRRLTNGEVVMVLERLGGPT